MYDRNARRTCDGVCHKLEETEVPEAMRMFLMMMLLIMIVIDPRNLTWIPKIRRYIFQTIIFGINVRFSGCK